LKRGLVLLAILSEVLLVSCRKSDSWTDFTSNEGNFAVRFPKSPTDSPQWEENGLVQRGVQVVVDNVVYMVDYTWTNAQLSKDPEADFNNFKNDFFEGAGTCTTISAGPPSPVLQGYVGRHYVFHCANDARLDVTHSVNLYLGRSRFYSVSVLWASSQPEPSETTKFLSSFHLLNPAR